MTDNFLEVIIETSTWTMMTPINSCNNCTLIRIVNMFKSIVELLLVLKLIISILYYLIKFIGIILYSIITLKVSQLKSNLENPFLKIVQRNFYMTANSYLNYLLITFYVVYTIFNLLTQVRSLFFSEKAETLFVQIEKLSVVYLFVFLEKYFIFYILISNTTFRNAHLYKAAFSMIYTLLFIAYTFIISKFTQNLIDTNDRLNYAWPGLFAHFVISLILYVLLALHLFRLNILSSKWKEFMKMKKITNFMKFETINSGPFERKYDVAENEMKEKLNLSQISDEINLHKSNLIDNDPSDMLTLIDIENKFIEENLGKPGKILANIKFYEQNDSIEDYYYSKSKFDSLTYLKIVAIILIVIVVMEIAILILLFFSSSTINFHDFGYIIFSCMQILSFINFWYIFMKLEYRTIYLLQ